MPARPAIIFGAVLAWICAAGSAWAEPDLVSRDAFTGLVDVRAAVVDGERSWLDGGFGKLRYGGKGDGFQGHASLADAALAWKPRLTWDLSAVVDGEVQDLGGYKADLVQAYLVYKPAPRGPLRYWLRAGLYYPQVSQEHAGPLWLDEDALTPSALDTWIGEEVKVVGGEASVSGALGEHQITATVGAFGYDDTSGTLLTFRGWALGDVKAGATGAFELPPLERHYLIGQPQETYPLREIDSRVGFYGRVEWRPPGPFSVNAFHYDNRGNLVGVDHEHQWAWATQFSNIGAALTLGEHTRILSQVLWGDTRMGFPTSRGVWFDLGYDAAYLLASQDLGPGAVTGRIELFRTSDRNFRPALDDADQDLGERGWALTGDYRWKLTPFANVLFEVTHVESNRPSRMQAGLGQRQTQTLLQTALRLSF
jgi:hypothetical protein